MCYASKVKLLRFSQKHFPLKFNCLAGCLDLECVLRTLEHNFSPKNDVFVLKICSQQTFVTKRNGWKNIVLSESKFSCPKNLKRGFMFCFIHLNIRPRIGLVLIYLICIFRSAPTTPDLPPR